jgi:hypothetical protein
VTKVERLVVGQSGKGWVLVDTPPIFSKRSVLKDAFAHGVGD